MLTLDGMCSLYTNYFFWKARIFLQHNAQFSMLYFVCFVNWKLIWNMVLLKHRKNISLEFQSKWDSFFYIKKMSTHLIKNVCFFVPTKNVVIKMVIHAKIRTLHRLPLSIKIWTTIIIHRRIDTVKRAAVHIQN